MMRDVGDIDTAWGQAHATAFAHAYAVGRKLDRQSVNSESTAGGSNGRSLWRRRNMYRNALANGSAATSGTGAVRGDRERTTMSSGAGASGSGGSVMKMRASVDHVPLHHTA